MQLIHLIETAALAIIIAFAEEPGRDPAMAENAAIARLEGAENFITVTSAIDRIVDAKNYALLCELIANPTENSGGSLRDALVLAPDDIPIVNVALFNYLDRDNRVVIHNDNGELGGWAVYDGIDDRHSPCTCAWRAS